MSYNLHKKFGSLVPVLKRCYNLGHSDFRARYSRFIIVNASREKSPSSFLDSNRVRKVSSSSLAKSDTTESNPKNGQKNILDDEEFRSILSDFSKDFGVGSDSEPILEEIRKSIDDPLNESEKSSRQNKDESSCSNSVEKKEIPNIMNDKFKDFSETETLIIPSYEDLQQESDNDDYIFHIDSPNQFKFSPDQLKRGVTGVYDIGELIDVLRKENLAGITTISVSKELHYADFLVIATAKSLRHCRAVCEHVVKLYKMKKHSKDPFVIVEGDDKSSDWKAIDMGNIVLHVFLEETRNLYDIESLWLFDSAFDRGGNQKTDPLNNAIEEQMSFFTSLNESLKKEFPKKIV